MYCTRCGHENDDGAEFCELCGASLEEEDVEEVPELSVPETRNSYFEPMPRPRKRSSGRGLRYAAAVLAGLVVLGGAGYGVYWMYQRGMLPFGNTSDNTKGASQDASGTDDTGMIGDSGDSNDVAKAAVVNTPTPLPTPVPTEEPIVIRLLDGSPASLDGYEQVPVIAAAASSTIQQEGVNNEPIVLFDGNLETSWQEGVDGPGIGEYVNFSLDQFYPIGLMSFHLGNWVSEEAYNANGRPLEMTIVLGNFSGVVTFRDLMDEQWIEFSRDINADSMHIEIRDASNGTTYEDTCISEIKVYQHLQ